MDAPYGTNWGSLPPDARSAQIWRWYADCLGRDPDPAGYKNWLNADSLTPAEVGAGICQSPEAVAYRAKQSAQESAAPATNYLIYAALGLVAYFLLRKK